MNQRNNDNKNNKEGEIGTPVITLDLGYREEDVEFLVSTTTNDGNDLNPHGRSLPERVALKVGMDSYALAHGKSEHYTKLEN